MANGEVGRPAFEPTPEQRQMVKQLSAFGIPQSSICKMIVRDRNQPISDETLRKYFADELELGTQEANAKVAGQLFKAAMDGNLGAICFWLKTRARWRETPTEVELRGQVQHIPVHQDLPSVAEYQEAVRKVLSEF